MGKLARSFAAVALSLSTIAVPVRAQQTQAHLNPENSNVTATAVPDARVSFWKSVDNDNVVRIEETTDGALKFAAYRLDASHKKTMDNVAKWGLDISPDTMTKEYLDRYCFMGSDNGLRRVRVNSKPGDPYYQEVVNVGHDFFRGVDNPKFGDREWEITATRPKPGVDTIRMKVRLTGLQGGALRFAGLFAFKGQANSFESEFKRMENAGHACTPSPIYPIRSGGGSEIALRH